MSLSNLKEIVKGRESRHAAIHGAAKCWTQLSNKNFSTMFDTGLRKNIKKKSIRYGQIGKYKLNEMGALKMKCGKKN